MRHNTVAPMLRDQYNEGAKMLTNACTLVMKETSNNTT